MRSLTLIRVLFVATALTSGCAIDSTSSSSEPTPLLNASSDDGAGVVLSLPQYAQRSFTFDCAQRCDVQLAMTVGKGANASGERLAMVFVTRPDGFSRNETLNEGTRSLSFAQLPPGSYSVMLMGQAEQPVDLTMRATWVEGERAIPGGAASVSILEQEAGREARGTLLFTCEEANGCDLQAWVALTTFDASGADGRPIPFDRLNAVITDPGDWNRALTIAPAGDGKVGLATLRGLPRGEHKIDLSLAAQPAAEGEQPAGLALTLIADWVATRPALTIVERLSAVVSARQAAVGCAETAPSQAEMTAAQEEARKSAAGELEDLGADLAISLDATDALGGTMAMPAPILSYAISALEADTNLITRIERCDRFGVGHAVAPDGKSHFSFVTNRR